MGGGFFLLHMLFPDLLHFVLLLWGEDHVDLVVRFFEDRLGLFFSVFGSQGSVFMECLQLRIALLQDGFNFRLLVRSQIERLCEELHFMLTMMIPHSFALSGWALRAGRRRRGMGSGSGSLCEGTGG